VALGLESVIPRAAQTLSEAANVMGGPMPRDKELAEAREQYTRDWIEETTLRPEEVGTASALAYKGVQLVGDMLVSKGATGKAGILPTTQAATDAMRELGKKGVTGDPAQVVAGGDALNTAIAFAYAATGSSLLGRMAKGVLANELADVPIGKAQQYALRHYGEEDIAESYDPLDPVRLGANVVMGALSGIPGGRAARDAAAARSVTEHYHQLVGTPQDIKWMEARNQALDRMREIKQGANWTVGTKYDNPAFDAYILEVEKLNDLPEGVLLALKNAGEKSGISAVSPKGARGIMQFMPATAKEVGLRVDDVVDERVDPWRSMEAAGEYMDERMRYLSKKYNLKRGDPRLARGAIAWYSGGANDAEGVILRGEAVDKEAIAYLKRTDAFLAERASLPEAARAVDTAPAQPMTDIPDVATAQPEVLPRAAPEAIDSAPVVVARETPRSVDALARALQDAELVPEVPGLVLDRLGAVHAAKTNPDLLAAFAQDVRKPQAVEVDRMRAAVLAKVYGEDAVPLLLEANAKTPEGSRARALSSGLLSAADAVAKSSEKIGRDVGAAVASARRGLEAPGDATPQGVLRQNLSAALLKARTGKQVESLILKAAQTKGKARAAAAVAKESDTFPRVDAIERPSATAPDGTKVEIDERVEVARVEELARQGRTAIDDEGNTIAIADGLDAAEREVADAGKLAEALRLVATACIPG
jgi:hypothetical protein